MQQRLKGRSFDLPFFSAFLLCRIAKRALIKLTIIFISGLRAYGQEGFTATFQGLADKPVSRFFRPKAVSASTFTGRFTKSNLKLPGMIRLVMAG
jgi:hypothetical protein